MRAYKTTSSTRRISIFKQTVLVSLLLLTYEYRSKQVENVIDTRDGHNKNYVNFCKKKKKKEKDEEKEEEENLWNSRHIIFIVSVNY